VEQLGKRSTVIVAATFALMMIGYYAAVTAMAADSTSVHCSGGHFPLTCTSGGQSFTLTTHA